MSDEGLEGFGLGAGSAGGFVSAAHAGPGPMLSPTTRAKETARTNELTNEHTRMQG